MKKYKLIILLWSAFSFADFDQLGKNNSLLNQKTSVDIKVVESRWLDKKFLSELSLGFSPFLRGFYYMNSYSIDLSYRLFLNDNISFHLKYSNFFNPINQDGKKEVFSFGRIPVELKYPPKRSYLIGMDWHPFYGKALLFNRLVYFDFYFSASLGQIDIFQLNQKPYLFSGAVGMVHWWHKRLNTRLELQGLCYEHQVSDSGEKTNQELSYKLYLSVGVLF